MAEPELEQKLLTGPEDVEESTKMELNKPVVLKDLGPMIIAHDGVSQRADLIDKHESHISIDRLQNN